MVKKNDELIEEIIQFWFSDTARPKWFKSTEQFDQLLIQRYQSVWELARTGRFDSWEREARSALALVIILDQFPLNMFRQDARQYSTEAHARRIAAGAIDKALDEALTDEQKGFLYLPFMHSESMQDQDRAVELYTKNNLTQNLPHAHHHRDIVRRFGRFPHRNSALGRKSTVEEIEYLKKANW